MKKTYRLLVLALVMAALACTALAAGEVTFTENIGSAEVVPEAGEAPKKFESVTLNNSGLEPGSQALLLMVQADATGDYAYDKQTLSEKNIVYIDQTAVGDDGNITFGGNSTFETVYPSKMCNSVLLLGGGQQLEVLKEVRVALRKGDVNEDGEYNADDFFKVFDGIFDFDGTAYSNRAQKEMAASLDGEPGIDAGDFFAAFDLLFDFT